MSLRAFTWFVACVIVLQSLLAPKSLNASAAPAVAAQSTCCDGPACCCGDPDICLCVAECPQTPMTPSRENEPALRTDRSIVAILARTPSFCRAMAYTARDRVVRREVARPLSSVRVQALLSVWLT